MNGAIDTSTLTCVTCHGGTLAATGTQDPNIGAAPRGAGAPDTYGTVLTTARGVGVHAAHVLGTRSRPVLCNACHVVPTAQVHKTGVATTGTVGLANLSTPAASPRPATRPPPSPAPTPTATATSAAASERPT